MTVCCERLWYALRCQTKIFVAALLVQLPLVSLAQLSPVESAENQFVKGKYDEAQSGFQAILNNPFATPRDIALSQCRLGIILSIKNKNTEARNYLLSSVNSASLPKNISHLCHYALLQLHVLASANKEALQLIDQMGEPTFAPMYVARIWAIAAEVANRLKDNRFEAVYLQKLLGVMERSNISEVEIKILNNKKVTQSEVKKRLGVEVASNPTPPSATPKPQNSANLNLAANQAQQPQSEATMPTARADQSFAGKLMDRMREGDYETAFVLLKEFRSQTGDTALPLGNFGIAITAEQLERRVKRLLADKAREMRIGIVLPAGSVYTRFNHKILKAVSAFQNSVAAEGVLFSFFVRTAKPEAGATDEATMSLILDDHVHTLIGPVSSVQTMGVVPLANLFSVPVFSLGPVVSAPETTSEALIRMGILAKSQALVLVEQLAADPMTKNAAVLAPDDAYGFEMTSAFSKVAESRGYPVTQRSYYDASTSVFKPVVEAMLEPTNTEERKAEFDALAAELKKKAETEKRKFDPSEVKLPPKILFDALFVPDSLAKARFIGSTFAFFDAKSVRFVGDKQWHDGAGKPSLTDEFLYAARVPGLVRGEFLNFLQNELAEGSKIDLERQVFDSLILIRQAQYKASGNNGRKMLAEMRKPEFTVSATTQYGAIDETGEPIAKVEVGSFKSGKILPQIIPWKVSHNAP